MKMYIAGPMSGIPQFNYPAFDAAASRLRKEGFDVVSPAEMDSDEVRNIALRSETGNLSELAPTGETWGDMLAADIKLIADEVDAVFVLPGWENSRGARLEAFVATSVQKPVYTETATLTCILPDFFVIEEIAKNIIKQGDVSRYKETS